MSKSVMISIRPEWCKKIVDGKKTIELRKTKPKLETPFKCYIYCTYGLGLIERYDGDYPNMLLDQKVSASKIWGNCCNGKVIGEFVCDAILPISVSYSDPNSRVALSEFPLTCLTDKQIMDYLGNGKTGYGWHISDLKIYDTPLELRQFVTEGDCDCMNCRKCFWGEPGNGYNVEDDCGLVYEYLGTGKTLKPIFRPPQSWCYVEGVE